MNKRLTTLTLGLLGFCCTDYGMAQEANAQVQQKAGATRHFEELCQRELKKEMPDEKRAALVKLFGEIDQELQNLSGKAYWADEESELAAKEFTGVLDNSIIQIGVSVPTAILLDCHTDDYVRQSAMSSLMRSESIAKNTFKDLPVFCEAFMCVSTAERDPMSQAVPNRTWVAPVRARMRLRHTISYLANVDISNATGDLSAPVAANSPLKWLSSLLQQALNQEPDDARKTIIRDCLAKIPAATQKP